MGHSDTDTAGELIRLNLGCGHRKLDGFINIDLDGNWSDIKPDIAADVTEPLPFENHYADEVHAYHVLEHIYRWQTEKVLKEWIRVLKPGGLLVIEVPCFDKIMSYIMACVSRKQVLDPRMSYWGLYGDPRYEDEAMCHRWCFGSIELRELFEQAGLVDIKTMEPKTHVAVRDIRVEGTKP